MNRVRRFIRKTVLSLLYGRGTHLVIMTNDGIFVVSKQDYDPMYYSNPCVMVCNTIEYCNMFLLP